MKTFRIDHPSDPTGKYLVHYSAEGPEALNVYSGNVRTGADGKAWVQLPSYFGDINIDPRYQLTVVDDTEGSGFVQVKVARKIRDNRFMIMTSSPNVEVSWEVKARRNDLYARKYGMPVELQKPAAEQGTLQIPSLYNQPVSTGLFAGSKIRADKRALRSQNRP